MDPIPFDATYTPTTRRSVRIVHFRWHTIDRTERTNWSHRAASSSEIVRGTKREIEKGIVDRILSQSYDKRIRPGGYNNETGQNGE